MVNIKGLDKARVLKALYDNSSYVRGLNHGLTRSLSRWSTVLSCWRSRPVSTTCTGG